MRRSPLCAAALVAGAGLAFVVAHDGTPALRAVRLLVTVALAVLVGRSVASGSAGRRAVAAFGAGLVAVPVAVGIAVPHVAKNASWPMLLAGVALLAGSVPLLVTGIVGLVRGARGWWRIPVAAALAACTFVAIWSLGQAVAATNVPRTAVGVTNPADLGEVFGEVEFPAADGVVLSGWYLPSRNRAAVVLLHGAGSTRSAVLDHAVVLARHGYGVLMYDARGHGGSAGRAMDFGWYGDEDVAGAVAFLGERDDVDPARIGAVGVSMGGEQAIGAAAAISAVRAVVAEGATGRAAADSAWLADEYGLRGAAQHWIDGLTFGLADLLTAADPPIALDDAIRLTAPRPVLLIAAGAVADEPLVARRLQAGSPATVEVWVVPGTGHTHAIDTHPGEWTARVTTFLDDSLGGLAPDG